MMLIRGELTGHWFVVTRWKEQTGKPGFYEALQKHALPQGMSDGLNRLAERDEYAALRSLVAEQAEDEALWFPLTFPGSSNRQ